MLENINNNKKEEKVFKFYDPKNKRDGRIKLASEFFGTIFLVFFILILESIYIKNQNLLYWITLSKWVHSGDFSLSQIIVFAYVVLLVALVFIIFERWSVNVNPAISFYIYLAKDCNGKFTLLKILMQILGGIVAGFMALGLSIATKGIYIDETVNLLGGFNTENIASLGNSHTISSFVSAQTTAIIVEFFAAMGLCFFFFSKGIKDNLRFLYVTIFFGMGIALTATAGLTGYNPARSFAPAIIHDLYMLIKGYKISIYNSELITVWPFIVMPFLGVLLYVKLAKIYESKIIPMFKKIIRR